MVLVILSRKFKSLLFLNLKLKYFSWAINIIAINILWTFFLYDIDTTRNIFENLLFNFNFFQNLTSQEISFFTKRFLIVFIIFSSTVLIDPLIFVKSRSTTKQENLNFLNNGTVFNYLSIKISYFFSNLLGYKCISYLLLLISIFFFSYSKTFIYFRF